MQRVATGNNSHPQGDCLTQRHIWCYSIISSWVVFGKWYIM